MRDRNWDNIRGSVYSFVKNNYDYREEQVMKMSPEKIFREYRAFWKRKKHLLTEKYEEKARKYYLVRVLHRYSPEIQQQVINLTKIDLTPIEITNIKQSNNIRGKASKRLGYITTVGRAKKKVKHDKLLGVSQELLETDFLLRVAPPKCNFIINVTLDNSQQYSELIKDSLKKAGLDPVSVMSLMKN